jgi:hypothetical protein
MCSYIMRGSVSAGSRVLCGTSKQGFHVLAPICSHAILLTRPGQEAAGNPRRPAVSEGRLRHLGLDLPSLSLPVENREARVGPPLLRQGFGVAPGVGIPKPRGPGELLWRPIAQTAVQPPRLYSSRDASIFRLASPIVGNQLAFRHSSRSSASVLTRFTARPLPILAVRIE